ncbi:MAG: hypothetical protein ACC628_16500 [Pirellulaceae bacterium]
MAFQKSNSDNQPVEGPACVHLRNKEMYVTGDLQSLDKAAEQGAHCWCNLTQHLPGPDQIDVDRQNCVPGRNCYRDTC